MSIPDSDSAQKTPIPLDGIRQKDSLSGSDADQAAPLPSQGFIGFASDIQDSLGDFLSAGRRHRGESRIVLTEAERRQNSENTK